MSVEGLRWALNTVEGLQGATRTVLIYLGDYADRDTHVAWPRHEKIAEKIGSHRETVSRVLQRLVDVGLIEPRDPPEHVVEWSRRKGRFAPRAYFLRLDRSRPLARPAAARAAAADVQEPDSGPPRDLRSHGENGSPCDLRSPDHVISDHRVHVISDHRLIGGTSNTLELRSGTRERDGTQPGTGGRAASGIPASPDLSLPTPGLRAGLDADDPGQDRDRGAPVPPTRRELRAFGSAVNAAAGLVGAAAMPLDARRLWRSVWKKARGNVVEAGQVAAFGRGQCAKARNPLTLIGLEKHYTHWRSGLAQELPAVEDAEDNDAFIAREIAQRGSR